LPGWKTNISGIRHFDNLPENARKFVFTITELLEVPGNSIFKLQKKKIVNFWYFKPKLETEIIFPISISVSVIGIYFF